jgi:hypothetical protein
MNTDKAKIAKAVNRMKLIGRTIGLGIMGYGLWISAGHITEVGHALQLTDMEAKTLFIFVDVVALFGKLLTSHYLVAKTRRIGFKLMVSGGAASLLCNVTAGLLTGGLGRALYGVVIVAIVAGIEYATLNIKGKTVDVNRTSKPQTAAPAVPAAAPAQRRKCAAGCQCGRHNRAAAPRKLRLVATP